MVILEYCLLVFKACTLGHPDFEIKFIDIFSSNAIKMYLLPEIYLMITYILVGEPKSRILHKHTFFAPERYTAGILYTDSLNSA